MNLNSTKGAAFSRDRKRRYALWRIWDNKPRLLVIGLNPSTADENRDDPTNRRVQNLARSWGYGGYYIMNLCSFITPYPRNIEFDDHRSAEEVELLEQISLLCKDVLFAWGRTETHGLEQAFVDRFPEAKCIARNMDGSPKHPLYVRRDASLEPFSQPE